MGFFLLCICKIFLTEQIADSIEDYFARAFEKFFLLLNLFYIHRKPKRTECFKGVNPVRPFNVHKVIYVAV